MENTTKHAKKIQLPRLAAKDYGRIQQETKVKQFKKVKRRSFLATDHMINETLKEFKTATATLTKRDHMLIPNILSRHAKVDDGDDDAMPDPDDGADLLEFASQLEENMEKDDIVNEELIAVLDSGNRPRDKKTAITGFKSMYNRRRSVGFDEKEPPDESDKTRPASDLSVDGSQNDLIPIDDQRAIRAEARIRKQRRSESRLACNEAVRETATALLDAKPSFKKVASKLRHSLKVANSLPVKTSKATLKEDLLFDKNIFEASCRSYGGLSERAREILCRPSHGRTDDDILFLREIVDRLLCFKKYNRATKIALARVVAYETYNYGRIMIKEGHAANELYFILRGGVAIYASQPSPKSGKKVMILVGQLGEGSSFGELELINNMTRKCTFICNLDNSEFLRVDKEDFKDVLQTSYEQEMNEKLTVLIKLGITKEWPFYELQNLCGNCKFIEFPSNKVIFGNTNEPSNFVYYIVRGSCHVVREIYIIEIKHAYGQSTYRLATLDDFKQRQESRRRRGIITGNIRLLQRRLWTVTTFNEGHMFGFGEDMRDTYVITQGRVECMFIPRIQFTRTNRVHALNAMREALNELLPDNKKLFRLYFKALSWDKYKQSLVKDVIKRVKRRTNVTYADVPKTICMNNMRRLGNTGYDG